MLLPAVQEGTAGNVLLAGLSWCIQPQMGTGYGKCQEVPLGHLLSTAGPEEHHPAQG